MKKVAVLGAGGFLGSHLTEYLVNKGYWVRGVDLKYPEFSDTAADEFILADLRKPADCGLATRGVDTVYQLAADMGGMGFISTQQLLPLHNNDLINLNVPLACVKNNVKKVFFSSSVCAYPTDRLNKGEKLSEKDILPAMPNESYGWEKLTAEMRYLAYQSELGLEVRIARFENTYGPRGTYAGGREKAPSAMCRKVAEAKDGGEIEVWGNGTATRHFTYVDDLIEGIHLLTESDETQPTNLGTSELVTVEDLAKYTILASGKNLTIKYVDGPIGSQKREIDHTKAKEKLGWEAKIPLKDGIKYTYDWVNQQINGESR